jgi:enoyl-CoA hydratase
MPRVLYERDGRIARVTLNCPEALNAIDAALPSSKRWWHGRTPTRAYM